jgi:hypothetical protein
MAAVTKPRAKSRTQERPARKQKKTFTLSQESIALLDEIRTASKGTRQRSASAVLDDILQNVRAKRKRRELEESVARYYNELPDDEIAEDKAWGEFAMSQSVDEDE